MLGIYEGEVRDIECAGMGSRVGAWVVNAKRGTSDLIVVGLQLSMFLSLFRLSD